MNRDPDPDADSKLDFFAIVKEKNMWFFSTNFRKRIFWWKLSSKKLLFFSVKKYKKRKLLFFYFDFLIRHGTGSGSRDFKHAGPIRIWIRSWC